LLKPDDSLVRTGLKERRRRVSDFCGRDALFSAGFDESGSADLLTPILGEH
jgi:hypothetical protein